MEKYISIESTGAFVLFLVRLSTMCIFYHFFQQSFVGILFAMQIVCDVDKRIIAMHVGCPGSCADSTVFKRMAQYKKPHKYFSPGEYLLADSAYGLSMTCIPACKAPAANTPDNASFNYCLARSRVRNEHCIGVLKSRWGSLREMRQQIRNAEDYDHLLEWVVSCCILHNMLAHLGDAWDEMFLDDEDGEPQVADEFNAIDVPTVNQFRETLKRTTLETNRHHGVITMYAVTTSS